MNAVYLNAKELCKEKADFTLCDCSDVLGLISHTALEILLVNFLSVLPDISYVLGK